MLRDLEVARVIDASAERAWALLIDTARWTAWGPSIREVACTERCLRAGTRGRVRTVVGWLDFEVTRFVDGHAWAWRVAGVRATGHRVEPLGADRCRIVFEVPMLAWPYVIVCRRALRRIACLLE